MENFFRTTVVIALYLLILIGLMQCVVVDGLKSADARQDDALRSIDATLQQHRVDQARAPQ